MNTPESEILIKFMKKLESKYADKGGVGCSDQIDPALLSSDPLVAELVFSLLVWESSIEHAVRATEAIDQSLIDLNELRVCTPEELTALLPARYPRSLERSQRLISVLNTIFQREHQLELSHLRDMSKREVIDYFASIDGLPLFASSRVVLFGLGWHAFPLDEWLNKQLVKQGVMTHDTDISAQTQRMERMIRASDSLKFYTLVEHWASDQRAIKLTGAKVTKGAS